MGTGIVAVQSSHIRPVPKHPMLYDHLTEKPLKDPQLFANSANCLRGEPAVL
jgi:hypothetical protein